MNAASLPLRSAEDHLGGSGWKRHETRAGLWFRRTNAGTANLRGQNVSSDWQAWHLSGGVLSYPAPSEILQANAGLRGPCKFTASASDGSFCRFDLPLALLRNRQEADLPSGSLVGQDPLEAWAAVVAAVATGTATKSDQPVPAAGELAAWLEKAGWPASVADEEVRVSVSLPGLFRQIRLDCCGQQSGRLSCELTEITSWPAVCRDAALALAASANERLRLARFAAVASEQGEKLYVEIDLTPAQIPGVWLGLAVEAMYAAIRLTARELTALRDPELAKWTLAAASAP